MAKQKKVLQRLLRLLNDRPMTQHEIRSRLKVNRRTVYENCKEGSRKGWIAHDNELKIYHLTVVGKALISAKDFRISGMLKSIVPKRLTSITNGYVNVVRWN